MEESSDRQIILPAEDAREHLLRQGRMPVPRGRRDVSARPLLYAVPRLASYALVLFGIWIVLEVMFPPLFVRSSERAVINSPVSLITTPVDGIVGSQEIAEGGRFAAGQSLMTLQNPNIDRTLLMELMGKQLDSQQRYHTTKSKLEGDQARLEQIDAEIKNYQAASDHEHSAKIRGIQARLAAASEQVVMQEDVVNRNQAMQWAGAVSEAYTSASRTQLAALAGSRNAIRAELDTAVGNSKAARGKVYTSDADSAIGALVQKQSELRAEIAQLQAGLAQQSEYDKSVEKLVAAEQARLERVSNYDVKAYSSGIVQDVLTPPGTRVSAGATLMRTTHCSETRVVAVFPRSLSKKLLPGTKVSVNVDGAPTPTPGSISEILPRAPPESDQARYFVPFPPIEKNEIYLIARLDRASPNMAAVDGQQGNCALGHWAKVSLDNEWWDAMAAKARLDSSLWSSLKTKVNLEFSRWSSLI
jgi:multidrug resistance efflux pump